MTRPEVRRAAGLVATAVVVAIVCAGLGYWQWTRHEHRTAEIARVEANYDARPVPLDDVLASPADTLARDEVWTPVRVTGRYRPDDTVLLRNRPVAGRPSLHVLVPFEVTDPAGAAGTLLVVDRGWIPTDVSPDDAPPPAGEVELVVRLRADEPPSARDAPTGQVQAISVPQVLDAAGLDPGTPTFDAYGALAAETPAPELPLGALPQPSTDPGSHLSYALQWWTFALGALVGFAILARRELVAPGEADAPDAGGTRSEPGADRAPHRRRRGRDARRGRGPSAEDVEDALIDAQLR